MASTTDDVSIVVRLRNSHAAAAAARQVAREVDGIGRSARRSASNTSFLRAAGDGLSTTFSQIGSAARSGAIGLGAFAAAAGAYGVTAGLKFDASMEQNQVAFTHFLGSAQKARAYLLDLFQIAKTTPFEMEGVTTVARRLMAFGFTAKDTNKYLYNIADTISAMGGGNDELTRFATILGQIKAKGKLQGDELIQLGELGINGKGILQKQLHLTASELADLQRTGSLTAEKTIPALMKGLDETFGGSSAKQAKTFNGQISTLKDNLSQTLGVLSMPLFNALRKDVFPSLNKAAGDVTAIFKRKDLSFKEKFDAAKRTVGRDLRPLINEITRGIRNAHLGDKLANFVEQATPKIIDAAAQAAPRAAGAFVSAWLHAGFWGKLLTLAFLGKRLGVFSVLGGMASARFVGRFGKKTGEDLPEKIGPGSPTGSGIKGAMAALGRVSGVAFGVAAALEIGNQISHSNVISQALRDVFKAPGDDGSVLGFGASVLDAANPVNLGRNIGNNIAGGSVKTKVISGQGKIHLPKGPSPRKPPPQTRTPRAHTSGVIHTHVYIDKREIARAVSDDTRDRRNRR